MPSPGGQVSGMADTGLDSRVIREFIAARRGGQGGEVGDVLVAALLELVDLFARLDRGAFRWTLSPLDCHAHLLPVDPPRGVLKARCGAALPCLASRYDEQPRGSLIRPGCA